MKPTVAPGAETRTNPVIGESPTPPILTLPNVVCAWCKEVLIISDDLGPISHGICLPCRDGLKAASEAERLFTQDPASWTGSPFFRPFSPKVTR